MSFPRYPKYKASGVEWLGDVPEHWEAERVRWFFEIKKRIAGELGYDVLSITQQGIKVKDLESNVGQLSMDYSKYQIVEAGDFAMNHMDLLTGYVDIAKQRGVTSPDYRVFAIRDSTICFDKYLLFFFQMGYKNKIFYAFGQGSSHFGRWRLPAEQFNNLRFPLPPLPEQTAIAEFLDRETGKIDELVAEQRRLMELLKEKRQAVISHAVTKGLNPHAPMKPSGIEWLGDVPEGWEIGKLGYACKLRGGFAFAAADFGTEGVAVVKMNNLKRGRLDLTESARIPESSCNGTVALLEGDLVWGMSGSTGETGSLGNFARVRADDLPCQLNQRVGRFQVDSAKLDLNFVEQVIQTPYFYEQIMLLVTGTAQYNVSSEQVQSCIFVLPPVAEQTAIAKFLDAELLKFDTLTAEAQRAIDLLQERRTALISAAVTGQIDVRQQTSSTVRDSLVVPALAGKWAECSWGAG